MRKYKKYSKKTGKYKSKLEASVAERLDVIGIEYEYEGDELQYSIPKKYIPDFVYELPNGQRVYLEIKGWFRYEDMQKMRAVKRDNPDLDIRLVFAHDGRAYSGSEMRYSDWADKNGFPYCIGDVPKHWSKK